MKFNGKWSTVEEQQLIEEEQQWMEEEQQWMEEEQQWMEEEQRWMEEEQQLIEEEQQLIKEALTFTSSHLPVLYNEIHRNVLITIALSIHSLSPDSC